MRCRRPLRRRSGGCAGFIRSGSWSSKDQLQVKGEVTLATPFSPPLNPPANGVRFRLEDAAGTLYDFTVPPTAVYVPQGIAWTTKASNAATTWKWSGQVTYNALYSPDAPHGFYWVQLKAIHAVGRVKFKLKGLHSDYKAHSQNPPYAFGLTFAPPFAGTSQCGEARFPGPAPAPSCTLTTSRLVCK